VSECKSSTNHWWLNFGIYRTHKGRQTRWEGNPQTRETALVKDATYLWLKSHIEHAVCLVEYQVCDLLQANLPRLEKVVQAAGCCRDNLHPVPDLPKLCVLWCATIAAR
jgi:hypothetical protein